MNYEITINGIKLTIVATYEEMCHLAADMLLERIRNNPAMSLLVPTGSTPLGLYDILAKEHSGALGQAIFFNMDEYCIMEKGHISLISETHPAGYRKYMQENLFDRILPKATHFPGTENVQQEGYYDNLIKDSGGIDLCVNAMGEDGHTFGFNSPGTSFSSRTRLVKVNEETRGVNENITGMTTPEYAITVGLLTGMASKEILFLVSGERKAEILHKVVFAQEPTPLIPATILREHHQCHWIVDEKAAVNLR